MSTVSSIDPSTSDAARSAPTRHHEFLILGGGTGGVTVAAQLCRKVAGADVAIVEPSEDHYYQPFWTLVGAGVVSKEASRKRQQDVIPSGATWIHDSVASFDPLAEQRHACERRARQLPLPDRRDRPADQLVGDRRPRRPPRA